MGLLVNLNENNPTSSKKMKLALYFVIFYSIGLAGALYGEWQDAGINKLWREGFSVFDQLELFFERIFSFAGFIDTFLFPSLASAITITTSIYFYRHFSKKLKKSSTKPAFAFLVVLSAALVWSLLSFILVIVTL